MNRYPPGSCSSSSSHSAPAMSLVPFSVTTSPDGRPLTNLGMNVPGSPWPFRQLTEPELTNELSRHANAKTSNVSGLRVDSVWFQPAQGENNNSQDRIYDGVCEVSGEQWALAAVFDGHAGEECAEHTVKNLPGHLQQALSAHTGGSVANRIANAVVSFDDAITDQVRSIFPNPELLASTPAHQLEAMINDHASGGTNYKKIILAMRGTTALVSLVDESRKNMWVAGVGDSPAVLGIKRHDGTWTARNLVVPHNGRNEEELQRVRDAHPEEPDATLRNRVLGAIAVTRAIGDVAFKVPAAYTEQVFLRAKPGFRVHSSVEAFTKRNLSPPYLSAIPDVVQVSLEGDAEGTPRFVLLMSDGVIDDALLHVRGDTEPTSFQRWVELVGACLDAGESGAPSNLALAVLRDVFGGANEQQLSAYLTLDSDEKWIDDTSIQVMVF